MANNYAFESSETVVTQQPKSIKTETGAIGLSQLTLQASVGDCPSGLETLLPLDTLKVKKKMNLLNLLANLKIPMNTSFYVKDHRKRTIYSAFEESTNCQRCCFEADRRFDMHLMNKDNQEVLRVSHPHKSCSGSPSCGRGCAEEIKVESPVGTVIGYALERYGDYYVVRQDPESSTLLYIGDKFKCCSCGCTCDCGSKDDSCSCDGLNCGRLKGQFSCRFCYMKLVKIPISNSDHNEIGCIQVKFYTTSCINVPPSFKIKLPAELDVKLKAMVLAFVFFLSIKIEKRTMFGEDLGVDEADNDLLDDTDEEEEGEEEEEEETKEPQVDVENENHSEEPTPDY